MSKIIVGNWKMNGSKALIDALFTAATGAQHSVSIPTTCPCGTSIKSCQSNARIETDIDVDIVAKCYHQASPSLKNSAVICPPFSLISYAAQVLSPLFSIGAQDCSEFDSGAHTGDVSCAQIQEAGGTFVILGHSERRQGNGESDGLIARKLACARNNRLTPIVCVGESRDDYSQKKTREVLSRQLLPLRSHLGAGSVFIAYEPIWAIGSGLVPSNAEIDDVHKFIFETCGITPFYGGSVTADNYKPIIELDSVGGLLIGGESLKPERFVSIIYAEVTKDY
ncbi:MAG: triose-phosphate isomerase [Holosporales bacterium]|nr:triose-phosphate isomerase [Holosporales bacterium]